MSIKKRLIDANALKDEILSWAVCINKPHLLSRDDTMCVIDTAPTVDAVEVDTVAEMLAYVHGDECACNFGCHDEWLSMVCDYAETECPHPKEPNGCWKQFVKHWGERKDNAID